MKPKILACFIDEDIGVRENTSHTTSIGGVLSLPSDPPPAGGGGAGGGRRGRRRGEHRDPRHERAGSAAPPPAGAPIRASVYFVISLSLSLPCKVLRSMQHKTFFRV